MKHTVRLDLRGVLCSESRTNISTGQWLLVDPLDGTINFTRGIHFYLITVAQVTDGIVQAGIVMPVCYDHCYAAVDSSMDTRW